MTEFEIKHKIARAIAEQQPSKDGINKSTENIYKTLQEQLRLNSVCRRRELLLNFAEYSENDKTSEAIDECVDNYLDSIK